MSLIAAGAAASPVFQRLPPVPDPHGFAGAFAGVHEGRLLAGGGANFPDGVMPWEGGRKVWHDRVFALDLDKAPMRWTQIGKLPTENAYGVSLTTKEGVLIVGGSNAARHFAGVWLMTVRDGKLMFLDRPPLPIPLAQMAGAIVGRRVHVAGGIAAPSAVAASARHFSLNLDDLARGWEELAPLPAAGRLLATAAGLGDAFYLLGGGSLAPDAAGKPVRTYLRDAWRYSNGTWTRLPDLPRASAAAASPAPVHDGSVFVVSGDDGAQADLPAGAAHKGFARDILRFDSTTQTWHEAGALTMAAPVTVPTAPWRNGFIFFNGEIRPGVRTPQVFVYIPSR